MMVTYNRIELTKRTVQSILDNTNKHFNFVIIDNGSKDGTVEYLKSLERMEENAAHGGKPLKCSFHITRLPENKGIAVGRNMALKKGVELGTDWFCTIDNDVEIPEGWLTECIDIMKANPKFAMIGVNMEEVRYPMIESNGYKFQDKPRGNLGTACIVFPAKLQKMLGYFSTEYGKYGEEDADYGMRTRVLGLKLGYIEEMGNHIGVGDYDVGEYREWKTECHKNNLAKFNANCGAYARGEKSLYIPYKD